MEPTTEEQLRLAGKEYFDFTVEPIELDTEEEVPLEVKDSDKEENEYF